LSIRTHLLLLVLAVWLPAAGGFALLARNTYLGEAADARRQVEQQASGLNTQLERTLDHLGSTDAAVTRGPVQALVERTPSRDGGTVSIVDATHRVVARSRNPERWFGRSATGETLQRLTENRSGFYPSHTLDGVPSVTYLSPRNRHGWAVIVALPQALLDESARRVTAQASGAAALLLLIGLGGALYGARRIGHAVIALRSAAAELGAGQVPARLATTLREVNDVGAALHEAGQRAQQAQQHLQRSVDTAAAEAREAQARLMESQKHEAIGRLSGGLAHDFNNLLQTISTGLQLIGRSLPEGGPLQRVQQSALRASGKASDLVRQMLAFGRLQALAPQAVDLRSFLLQCQELAGKALGARVTLTADVAPDLPHLFVDPVPLELALLNLIFNARDAMPDGGRITVAARRAILAERPEGQDGDFVVLSVSDNGTGMDAQTQARAFDPYFTTKPVGRGSGLGLPQVMAFARQSGGTVTLQSEAGRGTCITLVLPAAPAGALATSAHSGGATALPTRSYQVLMVEDDALVASVVAPGLEALGHQVQVCPHADAARALLSATGSPAFDVLLTDVVMPGTWSGLDLADWCLAERPMLGLVVATGYSTRDARADAVVLRKPYTLEALVEALDRAVQQRHGERTALSDGTATA
jgi:signal transduction histidine kinase/ActR/RegA family two-component response regulator